ncbi:HAD family hydrolase [Paenibacillus daejeonensis]|uniref:HAD family hydrolase n=1 Tax=Paenibacillus daejeonensis TaxID=135193 RepID=UPI000378F5DD|nr:HAD family hydrolase [Paenibacillus daejeonensis]
MPVKGLIFDMDNTLLRSRINFDQMKRETYAYLEAGGILSGDVDLEQHTTSTLMLTAERTGRMSEAMIAEMWDIANRIEKAGMHEAAMEPGAAELLRALHGRLPLVIVTNNSTEAAELALRENGVHQYFDDVIGRDRVKAMKPEPDAFLLALDAYPAIPTEHWLSVGDAWIDGAASSRAGIRFIAYNGDGERMRAMGVEPFGEIQELEQLVAFLDAER